jgi:hypothetical protein
MRAESLFKVSLPTASCRPLFNRDSEIGENK